MIRVTVWNEFIQDGAWQQKDVIRHYPQGIHKYLESVLNDEFDVKTVTQFDKDGNLKITEISLVHIPEQVEPNMMKLKELRIEKGATQRDVADFVCCTPLTYQ